MHIHIRSRSTLRSACRAALIGVCSTISLTAAVAAAAPKGHTTSKPVSVVAPPHVIPDSGTLNADDLVAISKLASKSLDDQYAEDPSLKYIEREFQVTVDPREVFATYDKDTGSVTIETGFTQAWVLAGKSDSESYIGQNAFGATAKVRKTIGNDWGIRIPGGIYDRKPMKYVAKMSGAEAKALKESIEVRVFGAIKKSKGYEAQPGTILYDHQISSDATISNPSELDVHQWLLAVEVRRLEWVDRRTGQVLSTQTEFSQD